MGKVLLKKWSSVRGINLSQVHLEHLRQEKKPVHQMCGVTLEYFCRRAGDQSLTIIVHCK